MKKVILSAVMVLALAGGSVFAASTQNSNKPAKAGASSGMKTTKKRHKRTHRASTKKSANKNM